MAVGPPWPALVQAGSRAEELRELEAGLDTCWDPQGEAGARTPSNHLHILSPCSGLMMGFLLTTLPHHGCAWES